MITRYNAPTKLDRYPYGTVWRVDVNEDTECYYIQTCQNEKDLPNWIRLGSFLETALRDFVNDSKFMESTLRLFDYQITNPRKIISNIIKQN